MNILKTVYKILLLGVLAAIFIEFVIIITARAHQRSVHWALALMVVFVILVEIRVRIKGGSNFNSLLKVHIMAAVTLLATLVLLNFWFNGYRHPYHVWLAYLSFALFLATAGTGIPMILERF